MLSQSSKVLLHKEVLPNGKYDIETNPPQSQRLRYRFPKNFTLEFCTSIVKVNFIVSFAWKFAKMIDLIDVFPLYLRPISKTFSFLSPAFISINYELLRKPIAL